MSYRLYRMVITAFAGVDQGQSIIPGVDFLQVYSDIG